MTTRAVSFWNLFGTRPKPKSLVRRRLLIQLLCGTWMLVIVGCHRVPQVANDDAVYKELDALYTAVTSRRRNLLDDCHERLNTLHQSGKLPEAGFTELASIIKTAESNEWSTAAQQLYDFMRAQRRDKAK